MTRDRRTSTGFTLIEVLVVVVVIAVLIGLLVPAVQSAREASRRVQCLNHLRQIGLGLSSYLSSNDSYPGGRNGLGYSYLTAILPQLDEAPLFHSINFGERAYTLDVSSRNLTAHRHQLGVLLCPSNPVDRWDRIATTGYAGSRGYDLRDFEDHGAFSSWSRTPTRVQDFADGTSTTVAVSEWVVGDANPGSRDRLASTFDLPGRLYDETRIAAFAAACREADPLSAKVGNTQRGGPWLYGEYNYSLYNHNNIPNSLSCVNQGMTQAGFFTAGGRHPGGVNVLFADMHSRFVKQGISPELWRAIGTRDGREAVDHGP